MLSKVRGKFQMNLKSVIVVVREHNVKWVKTVQSSGKDPIMESHHLTIYLLDV